MTSANASRILRITLEFTGTGAHMDQLRRWLNRSEHPTKKGSTIDFQYAATTGTKKSLPVDSYILKGVQSNTRVETVKIRKALQRQ